MAETACFFVSPRLAPSHLSAWGRMRWREVVAFEAAGPQAPGSRGRPRLQGGRREGCGYACSECDSMCVRQGVYL